MKKTRSSCISFCDGEKVGHFSAIVRLKAVFFVFRCNKWPLANRSLFMAFKQARLWNLKEEIIPKCRYRHGIVGWYILCCFWKPCSVLEDRTLHLNPCPLSTHTFCASKLYIYIYIIIYTKQLNKFGNGFFSKKKSSRFYFEWDSKTYIPDKGDMQCFPCQV